MKKLTIFLLSVITMSLFVYPSITFAEIANDEKVVNSDISLDDVDFWDHDSLIQPVGRGECLSDERLGRIPPGYCRSGRITVKTNAAQRNCLVNLYGGAVLSTLGGGGVLVLVGGSALGWWNNYRFK